MHGQKALRADGPSVRYTGTGVATHLVSSGFWAIVFAWLRGRRRQRTRINAVVDAAAVTTAAAGC